MKRYAIVQKNVVKNVIIYDGKDEYDANGDLLIDISESPEIGIGDVKTSKGFKRALTVPGEGEKTEMDALQSRIIELEKIVSTIGERVKI